jgi:hypothetical protein
VKNIDHAAGDDISRQKRKAIQKTVYCRLPKAAEQPWIGCTQTEVTRRIFSGGGYVFAAYLESGSRQLLNSNFMVPLVGLEPTRLAALDFESSASTNSTTGATWTMKQTIGLAL